MQPSEYLVDIVDPTTVEVTDVHTVDLIAEHQRWCLLGYQVGEENLRNWEKKRAHQVEREINLRYQRASTAQ